MYSAIKEKINQLTSTNPQYIEFIKFCIVGVLATLIDLVIFYTVKPFIIYQVAIVLSYCISLVFNYYLTIHWTFKVQKSLKNLIGIVAAHLINLFVVRMGLMYFFVDIYVIGENFAYLPTLAISVVINFFMIKIVVKKYNTQQ